MANWHWEDIILNIVRVIVIIVVYMTVRDMVEDEKRYDEKRRMLREQLRMRLENKPKQPTPVVAGPVVTSYGFSPQIDYCSVMWVVQGDLYGHPTQSHIWMLLVSDDRCKIIPPTWMNVYTLHELKRLEVQSIVMERYNLRKYMAVAQLVFDICEVGTITAEDIKEIQKEVWELRNDMIRSPRNVVKNINTPHDTLCQNRRFFPYEMKRILKFQKESTGPVITVVGGRPPVLEMVHHEVLL